MLFTGKYWTLFDSRGFELEDSQLGLADRLERLALIMALAMHWCVCVGRSDAADCPRPLEKKRESKLTLSTGVSKNAIVVWSPGSNVGYAA